MMKNRVKKIAFTVCVSAAMTVSAKMQVSDSTSVVAGQWNSNFSIAKEQAERTGTPLLIFWASPGCGWCGLLEKACQTKHFLDWQADRKILMVFCRGTGGDKTVCKSFVQNPTGAFPYVGVYWKREGHPTIKELFSGRQGYMPKQSYSTLEECFTASIDSILVGWEGGSGSVDPGKEPQQPSRDPEPQTVDNPWTKQKYAATLPLYVGEGEEKYMAGTLDFSMTSRGKVSAKYRNVHKSKTVSFSGTWGTASAAGVTQVRATKGDAVLNAQMTAAGRISVSVTDPDFNLPLASGELQAKADGLKDWVGVYTIALPYAGEATPVLFPSGAGYVTVNLTSSSSKGTAKCVVMYPSGKKDTISVNPALAVGAQFAVLPVLKYKSTDAVSMPAKVRKGASKAPSRRAIVAVDEVSARLWHSEKAYSADWACGVFGSFLTKNAESARTFGVQSLQVAYDARFLGGYSLHGELTGVAGHEALLDCVARKLSVQSRISGFSISYKASTGAFTGSTKLEFGKSKVSAKFGGVALPGWGDGVEDATIPDIESAPVALGCVWFKDKVEGAQSVTRGFEIRLER